MKKTELSVDFLIKLIPMKLSEPGFEKYGSCHSLMQVSSSLAAHLKWMANVLIS